MPEKDAPNRASQGMSSSKTSMTGKGALMTRGAIKGHEIKVSRAPVTPAQPLWPPQSYTKFTITGMRLGEQTVLKRCAVDRERKTISIVVSRLMGIEGRPKTKES